MVNKVVSESQFSFIEGRHMLDCILIANELVDDAKRRGKKSNFSKQILKRTTIRWTKGF